MGPTDLPNVAAEHKFALAFADKNRLLPQLQLDDLVASLDKPGGDLLGDDAPEAGRLLVVYTGGTRLQGDCAFDERERP
jgi:hypothetical protein